MPLNLAPLSISSCTAGSFRPSCEHKGCTLRALNVHIGFFLQQQADDTSVCTFDRHKQGCHTPMSLEVDVHVVLSQE